MPPSDRPRTLAEAKTWMRDRLAARQHPMNLVEPEIAGHRDALDVIFAEGTLASRLRRAVGDSVDRGRLHATYARLRDCLAQGRMFDVD